MYVCTYVCGVCIYVCRSICTYVFGVCIYVCRPICMHVICGVYMNLESRERTGVKTGEEGRKGGMERERERER